MMDERALRLAAAEAAEALVSHAEEIAKMSPERRFEKHENIKKWRVTLLAVWGFTVWLAGTPLSPLPMAAAGLMLAFGVIECIRARRLLPWPLALIALVALACWAVSPTRSGDLPPALEGSKDPPFGITVRLEQVDARGMTVVLYRPESDMALTTDTRVQIVKWIDGRWQKLYTPTVIGRPAGTPLPQDGSAMVLEVDWHLTYGTLTPGWYRASVPVTRILGESNGTTSQVTVYYPVQFEIKAEGGTAP